MAKSIFISYGGPDENFARQLNSKLTKIGIRTFFFPEDAVPGEKLHHVMRRGINDFDKVILICSKDSLDRPGLKNELEETLQREAREGGEQILIPITLDDYIFEGWFPEEVTLKYALTDRVIADFKNSSFDILKYEKSFKKLIRALGTSSKITYLSIKSDVYIRDETGKIVDWYMEKEMIPNEKIYELTNREIVGTGNIIPRYTNIGFLEEPKFEGGSQTVITTLKEHPPIGKPFKHIIGLDVIDALTQENEDYIFRVHNYYDNLEINIYFSELRKAKWAEANQRINSEYYSLEREFIKEHNGKHLQLSIENPVVGTAYQVKWRW
ncbi:MAG: toll/interleukin-1 receptor domain-containing protein [Pseudomonadota bacterium]